MTPIRMAVTTQGRWGGKLGTHSWYHVLPYLQLYYHPPRPINQMTGWPDEPTMSGASWSLHLGWLKGHASFGYSFAPHRPPTVRVIY